MAPPRCGRIVALCVLHALVPAWTIGSEAVTSADLRRAATRVPGRTYRGDTFEDMSVVLNGHLQRTRGLKTAPCSNFSVGHLQDQVLAPLFELAAPELLGLYALSGDRRLRDDHTLVEARREWARLGELVDSRPDLQTILRDGLCHQAVMWFVHHLPETERREVVERIVLPLLPLKRHSGDLTDVRHEEIHADYESKVSCQQCHAGPISPKWSNATLPPPLPVDPVHPGRERQRNCDYQNEPPCGPCDGLGGPRHGDGPEDMDPMNCTVVAQPGDVPPESRILAAFPGIGSAQITGDVRQPLAVQTPKTKGKYPHVDVTIYLGWNSTMRRQRYDFRGLLPFGVTASQIYLQTEAQAASGKSTGAMINIASKVCVCTDGIAGVMDIDAFTPHSPHDPLDLPASEGGLAYLGRVRVQVDGNDHRSVVADHYMKWAFHFLVVAEKGVPGYAYGTPLRLYGTGGTRFVYSNWTTADPSTATPGIFDIPKHCVLMTQACREVKEKMTVANPPSSDVEYV